MNQQCCGRRATGKHLINIFFIIEGEEEEEEEPYFEC